jgi:hypothetical protein
MEPSTILVASVVGVAVLGVIWFGVRFWLASTRPVDIQDVNTPAMDRLNREALEGFGGKAKKEESAEDLEGDAFDEEEEDEGEVPEGLKGVVPEDEGKA